LSFAISEPADDAWPEGWATGWDTGYTGRIFWDGQIGVVEVGSGTCGATGNEQGVTWLLDSDDVLTISGTGAMADYTSRTAVPWYDYQSSIKRIVVSEGVTTIGAFAFSYCADVTSFSIAESVVSIGNSAMRDCNALVSLTISGSVVSIGNAAIRNCTSLESLVILEGDDAVSRTIGNDAFRTNTALVSVIIPEGVTSIGTHAFNGCTQLTAILIPSSMASIGASAFYNCKGLVAVTLVDGVGTIGDTAFQGCEKLTHITIPGSVEAIPAYAFRYCFGLVSVTLTKGVKTIGSSAFQDCSALVTVTLPSTLTSIGSSAFNGDKKLDSLSIPASVTTVTAGAFTNVAGSLYIPFADLDASKTAWGTSWNRSHTGTIYCNVAGPVITVAASGVWGDIITVKGTGFVNPDTSGPDPVVALQIDGGAVAHTEGNAVEGSDDDLKVWALITDVAVDGSFTAEVTLPDGTGRGAGGSTPGFAAGAHSLTVLSGAAYGNGTMERRIISTPFTVASKPVLSLDADSYEAGGSMAVSVLGLEKYAETGTFVLLDVDHAYHLYYATDIGPRASSAVPEDGAVTWQSLSIPATMQSGTHTLRVRVVSSEPANDGIYYFESYEVLREFETEFTVTNGSEPGTYVKLHALSGGSYLDDGSLLCPSSGTLIDLSLASAKPNTTYYLYRDNSPVLGINGMPVVLQTDNIGTAQRSSGLISTHLSADDANPSGYIPLGMTPGQTATLSLREAGVKVFEQVLHISEYNGATPAVLRVSGAGEGFAVDDAVPVEGEWWFASKSPSALFSVGALVNLKLEKADGNFVTWSDAEKAPVADKLDVLAQMRASGVDLETAGTFATALDLAAAGMPAIEPGWYRIVAMSGGAVAGVSEVNRNVTGEWLNIGGVDTPSPDEKEWAPEGREYHYSETTRMWVPETASIGGEITIYGEGWFNSAHTLGSTIALKLSNLDLGQSARMLLETAVYPANDTVVAIGYADATYGRWKATVKIPPSTYYAEDWTDTPGAKLTLQFLTGSLLTDDTVRTYGASLWLEHDPETGTAPSITTQPASVSATIGDPVSFNVEATGSDTLSYAWEVKKPGNDAIWEWTGSNSATLNVSNAITEAFNGYQYRVRAINSAGWVISEPATLTVGEPSDGKPYITTQPVSRSASVGTDVAFTAEAGGTPVPTVQWYVNDGEGWADIAGADSTTLSLTAVTLAQSGNQYKATFTNDNGTIDSNTATLTVTDGSTPPPVGTETYTVSDASGRTITYTAPVELVAGADIVISGTGWLNTAGTEGSGIAIKMDASSLDRTRAINRIYSLVDSRGNTVTATDILAQVWADAQGNWTATIPYPAPETMTLSDGRTWADWEAGTDHWVQILTGSLLSGDVNRTHRADFSIVDPVPLAPVVTTQPVSQTTAPGGQVSFTAVASGYPAPTVQWYSRAAGESTWASMDGATSTTLELDPAEASWTGSQYRATFTNDSGITDSDIATLTVDAPAAPVITLHPTDQTVVAGGTATFSAAATGNPQPSVKWQFSTNGTDWADVVGATSTTLTVTNAVTAFNGRQYRAWFENSVDAAWSDGAFLTVTGTDVPDTPAPGGPQVKITTQAELGGTIHITGTGFKHPDGSGSVVAIKIDEGVFAHTAEGKVHDNTTVWAIANAAADGSFSCDLVLPDGTETGARGSVPAFNEGVHTLRFLTGTLKAGDEIRTLESSKFIVGAYAPPVNIKPLDPATSLSGALAGRIVANVDKGSGGIPQAVITLPTSRPGDWVNLSAYYEQAASLKTLGTSDTVSPLALEASVRYPWGEGAAANFRVDENYQVSSALAAGAFDEAGTYYIVARDANFDGADDAQYAVLGWTTYTVEAAAVDETPTGDNGSADAVAGSTVNNYYNTTNNAGGGGGTSSSSTPASAAARGTSGTTDSTTGTSGTAAGTSRNATSNANTGATTLADTDTPLAGSSAQLVNIILIAVAALVAALAVAACILIQRSRRLRARS
jgi:hypothetical protein